MHMAWPTMDAMTPKSTGVDRYNPYGDLDNHGLEMDPLGWDTDCPFVTVGNLYGSSVSFEGLGETLEEMKARHKASQRKGMIKVGVFAALAAGAKFM